MHSTLSSADPLPGGEGGEGGDGSDDLVTVMQSATILSVQLSSEQPRPRGNATRPGGPSRLRDLRNLGPASERMLVAAGINTPDELDRLGSVEAYRRAIDAGGHRSLNFLWSLDAALLDVDWRDLPPDRKSLLRDQVRP
jgi:DNA transformation protein